MPIRLPGRRAVGRGGNLSDDERQRIEEWFVKGHTVLEVYGLLLDNGIPPPQDKALYGILNSQSVQQQLRSRRAAEAGSRIAQIAERTRSRNRLLEKIEKTVDARADAYAELIPGGEHGLVVFTDRKIVLVGKDSEGNSDYETVDIYKTDTGLIDAWDRVLNSQEKSDTSLMRNLRDRKTDENELAIRDLERQKLEMEVEKLRAELEALKKPTVGSYQHPTFPEVIVERLPDPVRPASLDQANTEEDEGATPEVPWVLADMQE